MVPGPSPSDMSTSTGVHLCQGVSSEGLPCTKRGCHNALAKDGAKHQVCSDGCGAQGNLRLVRWTTAGTHPCHFCGAQWYGQRCFQSKQALQVHIGIQHATEKSRLHVNTLEANEAKRTQFEQAKRQLRLDVQLEQREKRLLDFRTENLRDFSHQMSMFDQGALSELRKGSHMRSHDTQAPSVSVSPQPQLPEFKSQASILPSLLSNPFMSITRQVRFLPWHLTITRDVHMQMRSNGTICTVLLQRHYPLHFASTLTRNWAISQTVVAKMGWKDVCNVLERLDVKKEVIEVNLISLFRHTRKSACVAQFVCMCMHACVAQLMRVL